MTDDATSSFADAPRNREFVNYKTLPIHKARCKFYNSEVDKRFGFVTLLDDKDSPVSDAYLSGAILEKAGIYNIKENDLINVRVVPKERGDAVVYIQRYRPLPVKQPDPADAEQQTEAV